MYPLTGITKGVRVLRVKSRQGGLATIPQVNLTFDVRIAWVE